MPYSLKWEERGVHLVFTGHVTGQEIKQAGDAMYGHKGFDAIRYQIFDFTDATDFSISLEDMKEIAAIDASAASTNPKIRQAIVSNSETIDAALAIYGKNQPDLPWITEGLATLEDARSWIATSV